LSELAACTPARLDVQVTTDIASSSYSNDCHACGLLLSGSLLDYTLARPEHMPAAMVFKDNGLVRATNALGIKACDESGANGAVAPLVNAVVNALRAYPGA
jgi:hypothetical protein